MNSRLVERAEPILRAAEGMDDSERARLFDLYHDAKDVKALSAKLATENLPPSLIDSLLSAKKLSESEPSHLDRITEAVNRLSTIDPTTLEIAEKHPHILKALFDAATRKE